MAQAPSLFYRSQRVTILANSWWVNKVGSAKKYNFQTKTANFKQNSNTQLTANF